MLRGHFLSVCIGPLSCSQPGTTTFVGDLFLLVSNETQTHNHFRLVASTIFALELLSLKVVFIFCALDRASERESNVR